MLKKIILFSQNKSSTLQNNLASFSFSQAATHHSFTLNLWFLFELKHNAHLSESVCENLYSRFRLAFIKVYIFAQLKSMDSWL